MRKIFDVKSHYQKAKSFYLRFERWLMPLTLAVGFVVDYLTFINIQVTTALIVLFAYWVIAALAITFVHAYDAGKLPEKFKYIRLYAPLLIQFTFGGLLSNAFIFYWFSGSLWVSWPFILAFVLLMVSNDALRHHFIKPLVQISVYFFATLSIFSVALPYQFNSLNPWLFVTAGAISLLFILFFIWLLGIFSDYVKQKRVYILLSVVGILLATNFLYFANIIPPIPLSLREAGLYHSVQRSGGKYILKGEPETFWEKLLPGRAIHLTPGGRAYIFTAIFAPTDLNTTIFHNWQYYSEEKKEWINKDKLAFSLVGGRQLGFRGYSWKSHLTPGKWRVSVETSRGQILDRIKFNIIKAETSVDLIETIR